jgi:2-iminobutanoate/2-iminopropanoate deaminase
MKKSLLALTATLAFVGLGTLALAQKSVPLSTLPFSPARQAGPTLYVSGQVPRTPDGQDVRESVEAETRQVMDNLGRILKDNGYTFDDVVSATVYLKDIQDYAGMNKVYASYFKAPFPARATVGGVEIVFGFRVEISCIAYRDKPAR